jgi:hypothetical protein
MYGEDMDEDDDVDVEIVDNPEIEEITRSKSEKIS